MDAIVYRARFSRETLKFAFALFFALGALFGGVDDTLFETRLFGKTQAECDAAVERLFYAWERAGGRSLGVGKKGSVGLKVDLKMGRGLSTPKTLLRAVARALEKRGWRRGDIFVFDLHGRHFFEAGFLPDARTNGATWEGMPVYAFCDDETRYDDAWTYDSPLPTADARERALRDSEGVLSAERLARERKSFLPKRLLLECDFWINLPVVSYADALGIDGALANATIGAVSNGERFYASANSGPVAVAEIGAIPELRGTCVFTLVSLECYQYAASGAFNANYAAGEPLLWLGADAVWIDYQFLLRFNEWRRIAGLPEIAEPLFLRYAQRIGLGAYRGVPPKIVRVF